MMNKWTWCIFGLIGILVGVQEYTNRSFLENVDHFFKTELSCHKPSNLPFQYLATKRPYLEEELGSLTYHSSHGYCEPVQIWMIIRHGTRNPSRKVIQKMSSVLPGLRDMILRSHADGKGKLCNSTLEELKIWKPKLTEGDEKLLVEQGKSELRGIGERFKQRFPQLFLQKYSQTTHKFRYTKTERAEKSCKSFVNAAVTLEPGDEVVYPMPLYADPILRFYKGCPKWKRDIDKNSATYDERRKFEQSNIFNSVREWISSRLGLDDILSVDTVEIMYMTCAFETAWTPQTVSPWCDTFSENDLSVMQFRQDLEYYYVDGYGYELTYKQACPAVKDMFHHMEWKIRDSAEAPSIIAYFTHSGTMLKLLSRLGLFKDSKPLKHNKMLAQSSRLWRTSEIDKFATNLASILYRCEDDSYKVGFMFQEQPIEIPGCGKDLCPLKTLESIYKPIVEECDVDSWCKL